ncbi:MAG: hypothetical protein ACC645_01585 [Pirellulales bacterium]
MNSDQPPTVCFAHSLEGRRESEWEPLDDHLRVVADLASEFAGKFNAADWGHIADRWHEARRTRIRSRPISNNVIDHLHRS